MNGGVECLSALKTHIQHTLHAPLKKPSPCIVHMCLCQIKSSNIILSPSQLIAAWRISGVCSDLPPPSLPILRQLLDTGFFHADPHPGNLIRTPDGRLAILDFGLVTVIDENIKAREGGTGGDVMMLVLVVFMYRDIWRFIMEIISDWRAQSSW